MPADLAGLDATVERLGRDGVRFRIDPVLEPIGFGFARSLARYWEVRRRFPDVEIMMGVGNLTELTDVDSSGVNTLLAGFCQELAVDLGAVEVGHHDPGGELGDLAGHGHEDGVADAVVGRPAQGGAGEVADLDEADLGKVGMQAKGGPLGPAAGRQHHRGLTLGGGHVDLLDH